MYLLSSDLSSFVLKCSWWSTPLYLHAFESRYVLGGNSGTGDGAGPLLPPGDNELDGEWSGGGSGGCTVDVDEDGGVSGVWRGDDGVDGSGGGGLPCEYRREGIGSRVELRRKIGPPTVGPFVAVLLEESVMSELTRWCWTNGSFDEGWWWALVEAAKAGCGWEGSGGGGGSRCVGMDVERVMLFVCDLGGSGGGELEIGDDSPSSRPPSGGKGANRPRGDCCSTEFMRFVRGGRGGGVGRKSEDKTGDWPEGKLKQLVEWGGRCTGVVGEAAMPFWPPMMTFAKMVSLLELCLEWCVADWGGVKGVGGDICCEMDMLSRSTWLLALFGAVCCPEEWCSRLFCCEWLPMFVKLLISGSMKTSEGLFVNRFNVFRLSVLRPGDFSWRAGQRRGCWYI